MFNSKKLLATALALALACSPASAQLLTTHAGPAAGGPKGIPVSNACVSTPGTTITFTAQGTGGANANRISVVSINWSSAGSSQLTGVTIGGVAMTRAIRATASLLGNNSEIWFVANPTGTSSTIVLTASVALTAATIEVYSLIGYKSVIATTVGTTSVSQAYNNKQLAIAAGSRATNVSTSLSNMTNDFSSACGVGLWGVHASQALHGNNGTLTSAINPTTSNPEIALAVWSAQATVLPVANTILWWDASVFTSMTFTGSNILTITDQSGNGNNGGNNAAFAGKPTYQATGLNSRPTMQCGPTIVQSLAINPLVFGTGSTLTLWVVGYFNSPSHQYGRFISYAASGASLDFDNISSFFFARDSSTTSVVIGRNNNFRSSSIAAGYGTPRRFIATIKADGTQAVYVNNSKGATTYTGGAFGTNGNFAICDTGYGGGSGQGDLDGAISEVGISTNWIDDTAVGVLDAQLATKWNF